MKDIDICEEWWTTRDAINDLLALLWDADHPNRDNPNEVVNKCLYQVARYSTLIDVWNVLSFCEEDEDA